MYFPPYLTKIIIIGLSFGMLKCVKTTLINIIIK